MADAPRRFNQSLTELNSDDFLYQLYRGAELLHDSRVHEAKEAIEGALRLQPRDPKGQNLLGLVYFRLGVYPHAIGIFEELVRDYPSEPAPRINLALCFLKTGQPDLARSELEEVTRLDPSRDRAWAYLGLAYERLGNNDRAQAALARAGRFSHSRRSITSVASTPEAAAPLNANWASSEELNAVRAVAEQAFLELDAPSFSFSIAPESVRGGSWSAIDSSKSEPPPRSRASLSSPPPPSVRVPVDYPLQDLPAAQPAQVPQSSGETVDCRPADYSVQAFSTLHSIRSEDAVRLLPDGALVFRPGTPCWLRHDLLVAVSERSASDSVRPEPPAPQLSGYPLSWFGSSAVALLRPEHHRVLLPVSQGRADVLYIREEFLVGFCSSVSFTSGHIPIGDASSAPMLKTSGSGLVLVQLPMGFGTIPFTRGLTLKLSRECLLGWFGSLRLQPCCDSQSTSLRDWIVLEGEGTALLQTSNLPELGRYF